MVKKVSHWKLIRAVVHLEDLSLGFDGPRFMQNFESLQRAAIRRRESRRDD